MGARTLVAVAVTQMSKLNAPRECQTSLRSELPLESMQTEPYEGRLNRME